MCGEVLSTVDDRPSCKYVLTFSTCHFAICRVVKLQAIARMREFYHLRKSGTVPDPVSRQRSVLCVTRLHTVRRFKSSVKSGRRVCVSFVCVIVVRVRVSPFTVTGCCTRDCRLSRCPPLSSCILPFMVHWAASHFTNRE